MSDLRDRVLLVVSALLVAVLLFGGMFVADPQLGLAREQQLFIGGALVFTLGALYVLRRQGLQRLQRRSNQALAVVAVESPVAVFLILFNSGVIPWPHSILPYVAGCVVIAPLMIAVVDWVARAHA